MSDGGLAGLGLGGDSQPPRQPGRRARNREDLVDVPVTEQVPAEQPVDDEPPEIDDEDLDSAEEPPRRWFGRVIALLVAIALIAGAYYAFTEARDRLGGADDYSGSGTGSVTVRIAEGADGATIARALEDAGVVASSEAYYRLALADSRSQQIQAGTYNLKEKMSASAALEALLNRDNLVQAKVTIPEGSRVGEIVTLIAKNTDIAAADVEKVLDDPSGIGLPEMANGNPEGYLFPDTYFVEPGTTAEQLLATMVKRTLAVAKDLDIGTRAKALGLNGEEILTVASILEYEGKRPEDLPKIARVLYNRLDQGMPLQLDSTVSYVSKREGDVWTTPEERADPSLYNTYQHTGLPPGPIGAPGEKTIEAALNPADGPWLYFLAIDLDTGETAFNTTYADHVAACKKAFGANTQC